jgi:hypothetical protein
MKNLDQEEKVSILLTVLEERYEVLRTIRSRVENIGLWSLGLLLGVGGWLIQADLAMSESEKNLYIAGTVLVFLILRFGYFEDLARGFQKQQRATVRVEETLKLYEPQFFDESDESVYPREWRDAGTKNGNGKFFASTYHLLYLGFGFLLVAVLSIRIPLLPSLL